MSQELKDRTIKFAIDTIRFTETLPNPDSMRVIRRQLIRCSASIGANYRAACRAKSDRDYLNKLKICEEEADESCYWLELTRKISEKEFENLPAIEKEASELTAIIVSSIKKIKAKVYNT